MANIHPDAARRLIRAAKRVEAEPRDRVQRPSAPRVTRPAKFIEVTTAIATVVGTGIKTGLGDLKHVVYASDGSVAIQSTGVTVRLYDGSGDDTPVGRKVIAIPVDDGWWVIVDYCP